MSDLLDAHEVADLMGVTTARVHQLATSSNGAPPVLPPAVEKRSARGKVTHRLFDRSAVLHLIDLREAVPPQGRGPVPWDPDLAEAELRAQDA